jgi:hypothetical protein
MPPLKEPQFVEVAHQRTGNIEQPDDRVRVRQHDRGAPFLMDGDFLKVTNRDGKVLVFAWNRKSYVLEPGESKFVPFEAIVDQMGDPRSMENEVQKYNDGNGGQGVVMQRSFEMDRLFSRYAVLGSHLDDKRDADGKVTEGLLTKTPRVEIETLNGQRVAFPGTNPDMDPLPVQSVDERKINTDTVKMLDKLESENADMRASLAEMNDRMDALVREREGVTE